MRLIAFAIVILAGAVAFTKDDEVGTTLILIGAVLGVVELFLSGFMKETAGLLGNPDRPRKPPTEE